MAAFWSTQWAACEARQRSNDGLRDVRLHEATLAATCVVSFTALFVKPLVQ